MNQQTPDPKTLEVDDEAHAGQAVYSPRVLSIYDLWVLGFSNRFVWKCPTPHLLTWYNEQITGNHLDVGVGTGYFLDRCRFPVEQPRLALMDLNPNCLEAAAARVSRYNPETYRRNVLEPIPFDGEPFDSIGLNYLLHCLPGDLREKAKAFDHLARLLRPNGVLFGSTILAQGVTRGFLAKRLMKSYNAKGIFSNTGDSLTSLQRGLEQRFSDFLIKTRGCVALFAARK